MIIYSVKAEVYVPRIPAPGITRRYCIKCVKPTIVFYKYVKVNEFLIKGVYVGDITVLLRVSHAR